MSRRRGLTLVEVLVAVAMSGFLVAALARAVDAMVRYQEEVPVASRFEQARIDLESRLRELIAGAYLSSDEASPTTYFVASNSQGAAEGADTLQFTALTPGVSAAYMDQTGDLTDLNERFGPQGGLVELAISTTPVGDPGERVGLFLREQRPPDGDPTQGGIESLLDPELEEVAFEFFDGETWVTAWDTRSGERRLPAAVRLTYRRGGEGVDRVLVVRLPLSDVNADQPVTQGATP